MPSFLTTNGTVITIASHHHLLRHPCSRHYSHHSNNRVDRVASLLKSCNSLHLLKQAHTHIFRVHLHQNNSLEMVDVKPDPALMTGVISATGQLGEPELADSIGSYVVEHGIERNNKVLTALVDMHVKCGNVEEACRVFGEIPKPDVYSYSALIAGLASHGHGIKALEVFGQMQYEEVEPDYITFVGVLTACSHTGLVKEGLSFWYMMVEKYAIEPGPEHYACMDLLGRSGRLKEAYQMVESMPMGLHRGALEALLAACRMFSNVEIAESVADKLFELEPLNTGNYMLLAVIYASRRRWEDAMRIRSAMKKMGFRAAVRLRLAVSLRVVPSTFRNFNTVS